MVMFYMQVTTAGYKKKSFKSKRLWKREVGRAKLIKTGLANDGQHHVGAEMECTQCIKLGMCVFPASFLLKEQTIYMWLRYRSVICGVSTLSLHTQLCSVKGKTGWRGAGRGRRRARRKKVFKKIHCVSNTVDSSKFSILIIEKTNKSDQQLSSRFPWRCPYHG